MVVCPVCCYGAGMCSSLHWLQLAHDAGLHRSDWSVFVQSLSVVFSVSTDEIISHSYDLATGQKQCCTPGSSFEALVCSRDSVWFRRGLHGVRPCNIEFTPADLHTFGVNNYDMCRGRLGGVHFCGVRHLCWLLVILSIFSQTPPLLVRHRMIQLCLISAGWRCPILMPDVG
jgi:hypothetical protein